MITLEGKQPEERRNKAGGDFRAKLRLRREETA